MTSTLPQRLTPHPTATPPAGTQSWARAAPVCLQLADALEREHLRHYLAGFGWQVAAPGQAGQTTADLAAGSLQVTDWPPPDEAHGQPFKPGTRTLCLCDAEPGRRTAALEAGADDCLSRPYEVRELAARLAALRRRGAHPGSAARPGILRPLEVGAWQLEAATRRLHHRSGRSVTLTETELRLLRVFLQHPRHALARDDLLGLTDSGCSSSNPAVERRIDLLVSRLRHKLQEPGGRSACIQTIRGVGYLFDAFQV